MTWRGKEILGRAQRWGAEGGCLDWYFLAQRRSRATASGWAVLWPTVGGVLRRHYVVLGVAPAQGLGAFRCPCLRTC